MKIDIWALWSNEKLKCVCLRSNKRCKKKCTKETVDYDQFKGIERCFKNHERVGSKVL